MARILDFDRGVGRWNQNTEMPRFDLDYPGRALLLWNRPEGSHLRAMKTSLPPRRDVWVRPSDRHFLHFHNRGSSEKRCTLSRVVQLAGLLSGPGPPNLGAMDESGPDRALSRHGDDSLPVAATPLPTAAGQAALDAARALARKATAPATLRAYNADWAHYTDWCAAHGFIAVPAAPTTVGAYLASLAGSHAQATIRRRLSALGKMHRFNDLAWNPAHRDIQGPAAGGSPHARPPGAESHRALTLPMLRQLVATCDQSARGRRDRTLLLFGFVGALRRSELVALRVEDVAIVAGGLRLRIMRGKTDQAGQGAEVGLPRGRHVETCPVRAFEAWQAVAKRRAGPLFRRISIGDGIGDRALHPDAVQRILAHRVGMAEIVVENFARLSAHTLRVGFITAAYDKGECEGLSGSYGCQTYAIGTLYRRPGGKPLCLLRG
jgi:integrase